MNTETVTFRVSPLSKAEMLELTDRLQMKNQSELFRVVVHELLSILRERDKRSQKKAKAEQHPKGGS